jgi:hypothetical protein
LTRCRSCLHGGRVSRRPYEFRDLHHSAGQCTVISSHEPARRRRSPELQIMLVASPATTFENSRQD